MLKSFLQLFNLYLTYSITFSIFMYKPLSSGTQSHLKSFVYARETYSMPHRADVWGNSTFPPLFPQYSRKRDNIVAYSLKHRFAQIIRGTLEKSSTALRRS
jgi:hypothetical protein